MSYEYSSDQARLDFPNPYRIENILWALRATILLVCALALIFLARKHLAAQALGTFVVPVGLGIVLFVLAAWNFVRVGQQLRVFFGRGQPAGLAAELVQDKTGIGDGATALMQTIRQGALEFAIPAGALNGVLYSLVRDLITAPAYLQSVLQNRFANLASYTFLLLIMLVAQIFMWESPAQGWVGLFFLSLIVFMAVRPISGGGAQAKVQFNLSKIVMITLVAILGPVALGFLQRSLPDVSWSSFGMQALVILLALGTIEVVFFMAIQRQIEAPPAVSKVDVQDSFSFNSDPNLLMQELDREMQRNWVHRIPNRRYARTLPNIALNESAGNFKSQLLEESQPMAPRAFGKMDWSVVMSYPRFFWLMVVDLLGVVLTLAGALALIAFAFQFDPAQDWRPVMKFASLGLSLIAVGGYAFRSAHTLWGRFDFESTLTWVEMEGSFMRSRIDIGNRLQDRVFTEREVVNVENMTLRVWVVQLRSVVFGHHSHGSVTPRVINGMSSNPQDAQYLRDLVRRFAGEQSIVVAPSTTEDARRMASLAVVNQVGAGHAMPLPLDAGGVQPSALQTHVAAVATTELRANVELQPSAPAHMSANDARFCSACGTRSEQANAFCEGCGTALGAT
jgi:hypothetical protein